MKVLALVPALAVTALAGAVQGRDGHCGGDNCARQVTGTRPGLTPLSSRRADCSSMMRTTVVPEATTTTITVTAADGEPTAEVGDGATESGPAIPTYASACRELRNYSSACSCWGVTAATTTAPRPTKTETVTVTTDACRDL